jgi:hypothetical protein
VVKHVFLKVKMKRSSLHLGFFLKLAARYCGPFEILEKIGPIAYMLVFPTYIGVHNVFHVLLLKKYGPDPIHIIYWTMIDVENERDFQVELEHILDRKFNVLEKKDIVLVRVQWT